MKSEERHIWMEITNRTENTIILTRNNTKVIIELIRERKKYGRSKHTNGQENKQTAETLNSNKRNS